MISFLQHIDVSLFKLINGWNSPFADQFMFWISQKYWLWIPLYLVIIWAIIKKYGLRSWLPVLFVVILITLSDQISSSIIKPLVERLRPSHESSLEGMVHIVNGYKGGIYGFLSSHAANSFAVSLFCIKLLRLRWLNGLLIIWTVLVSYSRIYLGVHYPADVICGWILGATLSLIVFQILKITFKKIYKDELYPVAGE